MNRKRVVQRACNLFEPSSPTTLLQLIMFGPTLSRTGGLIFMNTVVSISDSAKQKHPSLLYLLDAVEPSGHYPFVWTICR